MARRITLAKSIIGALPIYTMEAASILKSILNDIERFQRNFVWGHDFNQRKLHMISQNSFCRPKLQGGLGFKNLANMIQACLLKLAWRLISEKDHLWAQVMFGKYGRNCDWLSKVDKKESDLILWKELCRIWHHLWEGLSWSIGNGKLVNFWTDK